MSLNNISLPSQLIADLYQKVLVQDNARSMPAKEEVAFLGKNGKNVLIVVKHEDIPFLPDNELSFLTNVLSACQLGLMDVAIVNWERISNYDPETVFEQLKSKEVILFGITPSVFKLSNNLQHFTVSRSDGHQFVVAPSLTEIEKNKEAKKHLWMALKQLFGI